LAGRDRTPPCGVLLRSAPRAPRADRSGRGRPMNQDSESEADTLLRAIDEPADPRSHMQGPDPHDSDGTDGEEGDGTDGTDGDTDGTDETDSDGTDDAEAE